MAKRENDKLSDVELLIMKGVWLAVEKYGAVRTSELIAIINREFDCTYAYSSISTYIERLEKRGYLKKETISNVAQLIPLVSKGEYARLLIRRDRESLFDNDRMAQLDAVMEVNKITMEELAEHFSEKK